MPETRLPRAIIPGDMGDRPDLYDVETSDFVGTAASPELARWLCRTVWEQTKQQPLAVGEKPVDMPLCEKLDRDLFRQHVPGCRVFGSECDCELILANRADERPELAADPFDAARRYLAGPAHDADSMTSTRLLVAVMQALDEPSATQPSEPCDTASVQEVGVATSPRDPSPVEMVDQLTWECRRLADAQYDVGTTLGRLRTSVVRYEQ